MCKPIKYNFKRLYQKIIEVQASNIDEAIRIVQESYQNEDIVLDWGDFVLVEFDDVSD
ncbi:DpnD/PcfM family protein [Moraxella bovoculi]|uniref:DpnD/PcfM family protein n=1 Tax=Moraxella bovoculi TaxID=386891 RepID=UPI0009BA80C7